MVSTDLRLKNTAAGCIFDNSMYNNFVTFMCYFGFGETENIKWVKNISYNFKFDLKSDYSSSLFFRM
jgi:hypothetical protein